MVINDMKLLLASKEKFLLQTGYDTLGIPRDKLRIAYITTALNVVDDQEYLSYMAEYDKEMLQSGIYFEKFDLVDKTETEIRDFLADKNVIQLSGGNPFYLLKVVREVGFANILKDYLAKGVIYIGCSAGAYLMCPTVEVGAWKVDRNRHGVTDFTALNYLPFLIKCHYHDGIKDQVEEKIKDLKYPLKILRDDQALLIEGGNYSVIGGEEIIL